MINTGRAIKNKSYFILFVCFSCVPFISLAQQKKISGEDSRRTIDSLLYLLKLSKEDTNRVILLTDLCIEYRNRGDYDSAMTHGINALTLGNEIFSQSVAENHSAIKKLNASSYNNIGGVYWRKGNYDVALEYFFSSLEIRKEINDKQGIASSYNNIGVVYKEKGDFNKALENFYYSLRLKEEIYSQEPLASGEFQQKTDIAMTYNNIGNIYENLGNYSKALEIFTTALKLREEIGDRQDIANSYNNIGGSYFHLGNFDKAIEYFSSALKIREEKGNKKDMADSHSSIAGIFTIKGDYYKALESLNNSLKINEEIGDKKGITHARYNIGKVYLKQNKIAEAEKQLVLALNNAEEIGSKKDKKGIYESLSSCYSASGNWEKAFEYHKLYSQTNDSIFNEESSKQIVEMQTKYETEKKENENKLLTKENEVKDLEISKQKIQKYILFGSVFLIIIISFLIYNRYKLKQEKLLSEEMLRQEKLRTQSMVIAQENERKRIAGELHDGIGQMLSAVKLNVSALEENNQNEFQAHFKNALELIDESCNELRNISHNMMPGLLVKSGLIPAVKDFADKINSPVLKIFVENDGFQNRLESNTEIHLFRIVQELLHNIMKYASATEVYIQFNKNEKDITIMVEDNGAGFDKNILITSSGNGWNNINSRLEILRAKIEIDSRAGKGTVVFVEAPLTVNV